MDEWFIFKEDIVLGPYNTEAIKKFIQEKHISQTTLVRSGKTGKWQSVSSCKTFADEFDSASSAVAPSPKIKLATFLGLDGEKSVKVACPDCGQHYRISRDLTLKQTLTCVKCSSVFHFAMSEIKKDSKTAAPAESWHQEADLTDDIPDGDLICPHCWKSFSQESILYIATHTSLVGDPVLGEFEQKRFAPAVFNSLGQPLDSCGMPCTEMACPKCHLKLPSTLIDLPSYYFSIVGAPSSGKSYYLTTLVHLLRHQICEIFNSSFLDADPVLNSIINHYESLIFMNADQENITFLPKTELTGSDFSDQVLLNQVQIDLPKPFIFEMKSIGQDSRKDCNLVFYDNAGEQFQPGADQFVNPATQHLACSDGIIFLFDPLNDPGMRQICKTEDPQIENDSKVSDQTVLFAEMVNRIRRHRNMGAGEKCSIPLIIIMAKYDAWKDALSVQPEGIKTIMEDSATLESTLNLNGILNVSFALRELMTKYASGLLNAAEAFFDQVYFIPESNFGVSAKRDPSGFIGVIPKEIHPVWAEVPFLLLMHTLNRLPAAKEKNTGMIENLPSVKIDNNCILFKHPSTGERIRLPLSFSGAVLDLDGKHYRLPKVPLPPNGKKDIWN